jgi:hypothetical protein
VKNASAKISRPNNAMKPTRKRWRVANTIKNSAVAMNAIPGCCSALS